MFGTGSSGGSLSLNSGGSASNGLWYRQTEAVRKMLNMNNNNNSSADGGTWWKVLVYDAIGQAILSPLFSVKQLRDLGVTLHLLLHSDRDPVPDVPAVYFCQPTDDNLKRIGLDLESNLYGSYHFNFISPISRQKLEDLASAAIQANAVAQVEKVFDQYVNFICLENEMFTLRKSGNVSTECDMSYYSLNRPELTNDEMDRILDEMVEGLFAVCVTLGTIPIIRCPKGNAAEAVAVRLDKKIRENLKDARNSLFTSDGIHAGQFSFYRPLLVILDRQVDMATPLHHTWTYQALAHDVLRYSLNRVTITEGSDSAGGAASQRKTRVCDLDSKDQFWNTNKGVPFPQVAERIQEALEEYKSKEDDIKRMKAEMGGMGEAIPDEMGLISDNTQRLTSAVTSLPALLEKKRLIDMHTSLATAILDQIKMRKLDMFFEMEEKIMSKQTLDRSLSQLLADPEAGTPEDKLRLFLIYYLCGNVGSGGGGANHAGGGSGVGGGAVGGSGGAGMSEVELDQYSKVLEDAGCDTAPLKYLRRWSSLARMTNAAASSSSADYYAGGGTRTVNMFSKLMAQSSQFVMEGVKNLVVKKHSLPVTKIVEELMEVKQGQYQEEYRYFDPKILRSTGQGQQQDNVPRARNPFQDAIVFMVGGGNYIEYQNLMDYQMGKQGSSSASASSLALSTGPQQSQQRRIIYGCSTLANANQMMQQISALGHEM